MPKELNISPNERIDFTDFEYGTRTFTVDSLRAHVSRLMTGGYRGGFILEGFRVQIPADKTVMVVTVTNGIAVDRGGRLITLEEGDFFLNNAPDGKDVVLLDSAAKNYLMLEFTLADVELTQRAFWDPTYPNPAILDSDNDSVPQPKGKEFNLTIATRKAHDWTVCVSSSGFEDTADPNKLRIPLAIIPVNTLGPNIDLTDGVDTWQASTPIIEKPLSRLPVDPWTAQDIPYIQCADTRLFESAGVIAVYSKEMVVRKFVVGGAVDTEVIEYVGNDRENNRLYLSGSIQVRAGNDVDGFPFEEPEITDIVFQYGLGGSVPNWYLREALQYDCRPMFFAMTEVMGSKEENPNHWPLNADGERRIDSRQFKYWSGLALLQHENPQQPTETYPSISYGQTTTVTYPPERLETRIKQNQDFFRVLAALVQEIKYGYAEVEKGAWSIAETSTSANSPLALLGITAPLVGAGGRWLINGAAAADFTQEYVGSSVLVVSGANIGERLTIERVYGNSVAYLGPTAAPNDFALGDQYEIELNFPTTYEGYVEQYKVGSLQEVYNARIDQFTDTYAKDLNRRLTVNKVATITVGDGVSTFGDYNGSGAVEAAFAQAFGQKRQTVIYIKAGQYYCNLEIPIGSNTKIVGDGIDRTKINFNNVSGVVNPAYFIFRDMEGYYADPVAYTYEQIVVENVHFQDISLNSGAGGQYGSPIITNIDLRRQNNPSLSSSVGVTVPHYNTATNTPSLVRRIRFDRVRCIGGGYGEFIVDGDEIGPQGTVGAIFNVTNQATYMINLWSDDTDFNTRANIDIVFDDCEFENQGGVGIFKTCYDVRFKSCKFMTNEIQTTEEPTVTQGVEGITFTSRQSTSGALGWGGYGGNNADDGIDYSGETLIDGCTFEGNNNPQSGVSVIYRGWVNFCPKYWGPTTVVSNCQFSASIAGGPKPECMVGGLKLPAGEVLQTSVGVLCASAWPVTVQGCDFHSLGSGVILQNGHPKILGNSFIGCIKGVAIDARHALAVDVASAPYNVAGYFREYGQYYFSSFVPEISGNKLVGPGADNTLVINSGVYVQGMPLPYAGSTNDIKDLIINNNAFTALQTPIQFDCPYNNQLSSSGDVSVLNQHAFDSVIVKGNIITNCARSVYDTSRTMASKMATIEPATTTYLNQIWFWINHFEFSDNVVSDYKGVLGTANDISLSASHINISNNSFLNNPHNSGLQDRSLHRVVVGSSYTFNNNTIKGYYGPDRSGAQSSGLGEILLGRKLYTSSDSTNMSRCPQGQRLSICGNTYSTGLEDTDNTGLSTAKVCNGFKIGPVRQTYLLNVAGVKWRPQYYASIVFKDNDLTLLNAQYALLADKQYGTFAGTPGVSGCGFVDGVDQLWLWTNVDVQNNNIQNYVTSSTLWSGSTVLLYGNDLGDKIPTDAFTDIGGPTAPPTLDFAANGTGVFPNVGFGAYQSYLGSSQNGLSTKYSCLIDLRRVFPSGGEGNDRSLETQVLIKSNRFQNISAGGSSVLYDEDSDTRNIMGVRLTTFPSSLDVSNNSFCDAPLVVEWKYQTPWHSQEGKGLPLESPNKNVGAEINITNNYFTSFKQHVSILVSPATGFGKQNDNGSVNGDPNNMFTGYLNLNIKGNRIQVPTTSLDGTYTTGQPAYNGIIKLWHPTARAWGYGAITTGAFDFPTDTTAAVQLFTVAGGFHMYQRWAKYFWKVSDNYLMSTCIIIGEDDTGGGSAATATQELVLWAGTMDKSDGYYGSSIFDDNTFTIMDSASVTPMANNGAANVLFNIFGFTACGWTPAPTTMIGGTVNSVSAAGDTKSPYKCIVRNTTVSIGGTFVFTALGPTCG